MGLITDLFEKRAAKLTGGSPQSPAYWVQKLFGGGGNTASGVAVDEQSALSSTAVWRAVSLVSQTVGALPLHLYEREGERAKKKAIDHHLYRALHDEPNPEQTAMEFREMLQAHALTWGRAHAEKAVDGYGRLTLWPIVPDRVRQVRTDRGIRYEVQLPNGEKRILLPEDMFTLRGLGYGRNGSYNVIELFRESIGLTLAVEEFGARFFGNGATMGGVLEHPRALGDEAFKHLNESMNERHRGLSNAHRLLILEEGAQYKEIAVPPDKAQFLESRKFQINDVSRIMGVPPHKLAEMSASTYSNIEHQGIEYVQDTINPWCVRWEQALARQLLSDTEKRRYFWKHNLAGLVRGDFKTRMDGYAVGRQNGWLSANDIREMEDMNPVDHGDIYLVPLNMIPADVAGTPTPTPDEGRSEVRSRRAASSRRRLADSYKRLFSNAVGEVIKRERADVMREAERQFKRRSLAQFDEWLEGFYEEHKDFIHRKVGPVYESLAEAVHAEAAEEIGADPEMTERHQLFTRAYTDKFVARHTARSLSSMKEKAKEPEPIEAMEAEFDQWEETRVGGEANEEAVQASNAFAKHTFVLGGVTKLMWVAGADACPYCSEMDGKIVGIEQSFLGAGGSISAEGKDQPLTTVSNVGHPPLHAGCQCIISPV